MGSVSLFLLAGIALVAYGVIPLIVSVATPDWSVSEFYTFGPFKTCSFMTSVEECDSTGIPYTYYIGDSLKAVKAMIVLGVLCAIGALLVLIVILVLHLIGNSNKKISVLPFIAAGFAGGALIFTIIGDIVWSTKTHTECEAFLHMWVTRRAKLDLGYSFALSIIGAIVQAAGGALGFFGAKRMGQPS